MKLSKPSHSAETFMYEGSSKRRRTDGAENHEQHSHSSGQLSLLDVWGGGQRRRGLKRVFNIGFKYQKQLERKDRQMQGCRSGVGWEGNGCGGEAGEREEQTGGREPEGMYSSSLASKTTSGLSLFSLHESSTQSDISDGFEHMELDFDPVMYALEAHPRHGLHPTWLLHLKPILMQPESIGLHKQLGHCYDYKAGRHPDSLLTQVVPDPLHLYNWSRLTPLPAVKVVLLGARPSLSLGQSHGLAFSQPVGSQPLSGPIESIHRELANEYPDEFTKPRHGSLVSWARAGVLLLNVIQTAARDEPRGDSSIGWQEFTEKILQVVSEWGGVEYLVDEGPEATPRAAPAAPARGLVFIGWGAAACDRIRAAGIHRSARNHLILSSAGSPYAHEAHDRAFFNNNHFRAANQFLAHNYGDDAQINWCNLEPLDPPSP